MARLPWSEADLVIQLSWRAVGRVKKDGVWQEPEGLRWEQSRAVPPSLGSPSSSLLLEDGSSLEQQASPPTTLCKPWES